MNPKTKNVLKLYSVVEYKNIASYLEEMASEGWLLVSIKNLFYHFEQVDPVELDFNVVILSESDAFDYHKTDAENTLKEFCTDSGWTYCTGTPGFQIFYKEKDFETIEIHTDENEEYRYIKKTCIKSELLMGLLILPMLFSFISGLKLFDYEVIFSNAEMITLISPLFVLVILSNILYSPIVWLIKNKINLNNDRALTHFSDLYVKRKYRFNTVVSIVYLILLCISFASTFTRAGVVVLPILLIPTTAAAIIMIKRFKKVKKLRKKNIITYVGVSGLMLILSITGMMVYLISVPHSDFEELVSSEIVLEFSDFGEYNVISNHMRKEGSIFTPVYLDYYERVQDKNSDIGHLGTLYIECVNQNVVDYIVEQTLIDNRKYTLQPSFTELSNEVWSVDQGYYLDDKKTRLLLVKDNRILIIRSDMDFEDARIIEICKTKLELN